MDNFVLPERWCIDSGYDRDLIGNWFNENTDVNPSMRVSIDYSRDLEGCPIYHHPRIWEGSCTSNEPHRGYTEITLEQFKKYVLKQEDVMVSENKKYSIGDCFSIEYSNGGKSICLLAQVNYGVVTLIDIKDGNRIFDPIGVSDVKNISYTEVIRNDTSMKIVYMTRVGERIVSKWNDLNSTI
jgi:hypothetical protein